MGKRDEDELDSKLIEPPEEIRDWEEVVDEDLGEGSEEVEPAELKEEEVGPRGDLFKGTGEALVVDEMEFFLIPCLAI